MNDNLIDSPALAFVYLRRSVRDWDMVDRLRENLLIACFNYEYTLRDDEATKEERADARSLLFAADQDMRRFIELAAHEYRMSVKDIDRLWEEKLKR